MTVDPPLADQLKRWCEEPTTGCGRGEVVFDEEVHFSDKYFMDSENIIYNNPKYLVC